MDHILRAIVRALSCPDYYHKPLVLLDIFHYEYKVLLCNTRNFAELFDLYQSLAGSNEDLEKCYIIRNGMLSATALKATSLYFVFFFFVFRTMIRSLTKILKNPTH